MIAFLQLNRKVMTLSYRQGLIFLYVPTKYGAILRSTSVTYLLYAPSAFACLACILLRQTGLRIRRNTALSFGHVPLVRAFAFACLACVLLRQTSQQIRRNIYRNLPSPAGEGVASVKCNEPSDGWGVFNNATSQIVYFAGVCSLWASWLFPIVVL